MPFQRINYNCEEEIWIRTLFSFVNPLRGLGIIVALIATFVEEVGEGMPWYVLVLICLTNLLAIRLVSLLIIEALCGFLDLFFALRRHLQQQKRKAHRQQSKTQKRSPRIAITHYRKSRA